MNCDHKHMKIGFPGTGENRCSNCAALMLWSVEDNCFYEAPKPTPPPTISGGAVLTPTPGHAVPNAVGSPTSSGGNGPASLGDEGAEYRDARERAEAYANRYPGCDDYVLKNVEDRKSLQRRSHFDGFNEGLRTSRAELLAEVKRGEEEKQRFFLRILDLEIEIKRQQEALAVVRKYFSAQDLPSHYVTLKETMQLRKLAIESLGAGHREGKET